MSPAAGRPSEPGRSLWHPQQSYVAEETAQRQNSLSATSGRARPMIGWRRVRMELPWNCSSLLASTSTRVLKLPPNRCCASRSNAYAMSQAASPFTLIASSRDSRLFHIHSRWTNEAAFEVHAGLPDTDLFVERMQALIDPPSRLYALERSIRRSSVTLQILSRCRTPCAGSRPQDRPA